MATRTATRIEFKDIDTSAMRVTSDRQGIIEGLMSRTGNIDLQDDIVRPGAWKSTIKSAYERKAAGDPYLVPFLWSHNWQDFLPPGGVFYLDETKDGLFAKVQFNREIQSGAELFASYVAGTVSRQSVGYKTLLSDYEKIEGKTVRNLRACELMECSACVFPANPMAVATAVKHLQGGASMNMLMRAKDFDSRYQDQQVDDWNYADWNDLTTALKQAIQDCFTQGSDPAGDFEAQVASQVLAALRAYVAAGIALDASSYLAEQGSSDYGMMSMSGRGSESKSGYLNASDHAAIKESATMIMKHVKIIQSASANVERANARARAGALQGYPVYSSASAPSYFEEKEAEADLEIRLKLMNTRLEVESMAREAQQSLIESAPSPTAGVERALAALIERNSRGGARNTRGIDADELTTADRLRIERMNGG